MWLPPPALYALTESKNRQNHKLLIDSRKFFIVREKDVLMQERNLKNSRYTVISDTSDRPRAHLAG